MPGGRTSLQVTCRLEHSQRHPILSPVAIPTSGFVPLSSLP